MAEFSIKFISRCSACRENTIANYIFNGHASEICSLLRRARELWRTKAATTTATATWATTRKNGRIQCQDEFRIRIYYYYICLPALVARTPLCLPMFYYYFSFGVVFSHHVMHTCLCMDVSSCADLSQLPADASLIVFPCFFFFLVIILFAAFALVELDHFVCVTCIKNGWKCWISFRS